MAIRKSKDESERLTSERLLRVIDLLEPSEEGVKAISKKEACEFLGISYNTTRLANIIADFKEKIATDKARREERKGKPASDTEISFTIKSYLIDDMPISSIADALYRSPSFVSSILRSEGITMRPNSHDYFHPALISDSDSRDRFKIGETVYNARYNVNCIIKSEQESLEHGYVYKVWLLGDYQQFAYTAVYDLGSLDILNRINKN